MNNKIINIEICKSEYVDNTFNLRIGDIKGATEFSNVYIDDLISAIKNEIEEFNSQNTKPPISIGENRLGARDKSSDASSTNSALTKEYILKFVEPQVTIQEDSKEDFKKLMEWDEEKFMSMVFVRLKGKRQENKSKGGITITDVKIVDVCSKCRKPTDKVPKNIYGVPYEDKYIACVSCAIGENKSKDILTDSKQSVNKENNTYQEHKICPECKKGLLTWVDLGGAEGSGYSCELCDYFGDDLKQDLNAPKGDKQ
jgi:hypothetical protein